MGQFNSCYLFSAHYGLSTLLPPVKCHNHSSSPSPCLDYFYFPRNSNSVSSLKFSFRLFFSPQKVSSDCPWELLLSESLLGYPQFQEIMFGKEWGTEWILFFPPGIDNESVWLRKKTPSLHILKRLTGNQVATAGWGSWFRKPAPLWPLLPSRGEF